MLLRRLILGSYREGFQGSEGCGGEHKGAAAPKLPSRDCVRLRDFPSNGTQSS